jgi:hypothetical protein
MGQTACYKIATKVSFRKIGETAMVPSLDILKIDPGGHVIWRGTLESFVAAKAHVEMLALNCLSSPGEYIILDYETGHRVLVMLLGVSTETESVENRRTNGRTPLVA